MPLPIERRPNTFFSQTDPKSHGTHRPDMSRSVESIDSRIFDRLTNLKGEPAGPQIIDKIVKGNINQVIFFGEPGANKTTALNQLRKKLTGKVHVMVSSFDDTLSDTEVELGAKDPTLRTRANWNADQWAYFSLNLLDAVRRGREVAKAATAESTDGKKYISMVELFSWGEVDVRDRGVSSLKIIAAQTVNAQETDRLLVGMVPDRRTLERSWKIRQEVLTADPEQILDVLAKYKIKLKGYERLSKKTQGIIAKSLVSKMSPPENMKKIGHEILGQAIDWAREEYERSHGKDDLSPIDKPLDKYRSIVQHIAAPPEGSTKESHQIEFQFKAGHMEYVLRNEFGFTGDLEENAMVVFSPYTEEEISWYPLAGQ